MIKEQTGSKPNHKSGHIVVLTGATLEGSGMNYFILNNALQWKKFGYRVTIICQDRNAQKMPEVDSYIVHQLPQDAPKLKDGQLRIVIPDINNIIPIYATFQFCEFSGIKSKAVQQMTAQEIQTNISMTVKCLRAVCKHDPPFKIIANYMILSGIIAARGLEGFNIPYDIIVPGPALMYSVYPFPHLWKWVLPGFKKASIIFQHTQFVKTQFLKCFKNQIAEYELDKKVKCISPGFDPQKLTLLEPSSKLQKQLLNKVRQKMQLNKSTNIVKSKITNNLKISEVNQILKEYENIVTLTQQQLIKKWGTYDQTDQIIIYTGALLQNKGVGQLLMIAPKLISQRPTLKFIFCGSGPYKGHMIEMLNAFEEGDLQKAKLIGQAGQFITQVNIQNYFFKIDKTIKQRIIIAGLIEQQNLRKIYPFAKICIFPSKIQQPCSMSIIQSMCLGLTPICPENSWFSQVLNKIQKQYPELSKIIRVQRQQFFNKLPETIINTLEFIKNNTLVKMQYKQKIRSIIQNNFSWRIISEILAQQRQYFDRPS